MSNKCRLINRIRKAFRDDHGFSFTEMLVATLIMVLATGALTSALTLAYRHFYRSTQRTEAQFLCASLAEFVEDELAFSRVTDTTDLKWSKGTHNMGRNIEFYVTPDDSTYTKINEGTLETYGKLVITGDNYKDNYFKLATDSAYDVEKGKGYSLRAGMSLKWDDDKQWYEVEIRVVDKKDTSKVLSDEIFTVKPAIGTK